MKKLGFLSWLCGAALVATVMAACGSKSGSGFQNTANNTNNGVVGAGCLNGLACGSKVAFFAQNTLMNNYYQNVQGTTYTVTNSSKMTVILRDMMGVCDRNNTDGGLASCSTWLSGYQDIMIFADGAVSGVVKLVMRTFPYQGGTGTYYGYSLPSFTQFFLGLFGFNTLNQSGMYNPMVLDATISPVNNNLGFELRSNGPAGALYHGGRNNLIHFRVENGKFEDAGWDFQVYLNYDPINQAVAAGHMGRCQTQNCGVPGF